MTSMHGLLRVVGRVRVTAIPWSDPRPDVDAMIDAGKAVVLWDDHNLVLNAGLEAIAALLGGCAGMPLINGGAVSDMGDLRVASMDLGTHSAPPAPQVTDTTGVLQLAYSPVLIVAYPSRGKVRFSGVVPPTQFKGTTFTEECLRAANGTVLAKVVMSVTKPAIDIGLQFDHELSVTRV